MADNEKPNPLSDVVDVRTLEAKRLAEHLAGFHSAGFEVTFLTGIDNWTTAIATPKSTTAVIAYEGRGTTQAAAASEAWDKYAAKDQLDR